MASRSNLPSTHRVVSAPAALAGRPLLLGLALLALVLTGCGSQGSSSSASTASSGSSPSASSSSGTAMSSSSTTTTAAPPGTGKPQVTIGDKNYTEQFVLGQLYRQALEAQGFTVQLNDNIGPTDVTVQALASGSLAMYPEYLNVFDSSVAGYRRAFHSQPAAYRSAQLYAAHHGLQLLNPTPFSDTGAIGVTVAYAEANHLRSLRDLVTVAPTLTLGGPPQFPQLSPGLPDLERTYGFSPHAFQSLAIGDQYTALDDASVQAAEVNTTDGQLASGDYRLLADPGSVFGWGNAVPVVSAKALSEEGPAFAATVNRVSALLTVPVMRELNQAVDVADQSPDAVAQEFLETHGLIPPVSP